MPGTWTTTGNLESRDGIIYANTSNVGVITKIKLIKSLLIGDFIISVTARDTQAYQELLNITEPAGFVPLPGERLLREAGVWSSNLLVVRSFLNTISTLSPNHDEIRQAIANSLNIDLSQPMPNWTTTGDLENTGITYTNTSGAGVINKIRLAKSPFDGAYIISVTAQNTQAYQEILNIAEPADFVPSPVERLLREVYVWSSNLLEIRTFLNTFRTLSPNHDEIRQTIADTLHINLDESFTMPAPVQMTWTQIERDTSPRRVEYRITGGSNVIRKVFISHFQNGRFYLSIEPTINRSGVLLTQAMTQACFPFHELATSNLPLIAHYLNTLATAAPEFEPLKQEIARTLNIDLNQPLVLPNWNTVAEMTIPPPYITHKSTHASCPIGQISVLWGYENFLLHIYIRDPQNSQRLLDTLARAELQLETSTPPIPSWLHSCISFKNSDLPTITNFLNVVGEGIPEFEEIKQTILTDLRNNPLPALAPVPTLRRNLASIDALTTVLNRSLHDTSGAQPVPLEIGENQRKTDALGIKNADIPENFLCAIGQTVMTTPAFTAVAPHIKCDNVNLERCLPTHPFTKTPFTKEDIILDKDLKREIDSFIEAAQKKKDAEGNKKSITHSYKRIRKSETEKLIESANTFIGDSPLALKRLRS